MKLINKKQAGFTLIELIIVIVILGILAVTAAPKFLDLQGDAKKSTLDGISGAINGAKSVVYGKAIIAGQEKEPTGSAASVDTVYGYPAATSAGIIAAMDLSGDVGHEAGSATGTYIFYPSSGTSSAACIVTYTHATSAANVVTPASSVVTDSGC
jgi:MSHA pilin protein MshA